MPGIYIHIPFCKKACSYCDFHFSVSDQRLPAMIDSISKELVLQKDYLGKDQLITSIYFGGGTPSLISESELENILNTIHTHYTVSDKAEITLEANPDDITSHKLEILKQAGINRLSIGVQSFSDENLKFMNRAHDGKMALEAVNKSSEAGFDNITIDLIYGLPGMTISNWEDTINKTLELPVNHISCYNLTVEQNTLLNKWIKDKKVILPDEDEVTAQFKLLT